MADPSLARRDFIKLCTIGGIAVYSAPSLMASQAKAPTPKYGEHGSPKFRLDAVAKVTGSKIYGRDLRSADMDGWPSAQGHAYLVRLDRVDKIYNGLNLDSLESNERPSKVITASTLASDNLGLPGFFGANAFVQEGTAPEYYGHAAALLLFDDFATYKRAKSKLKFADNLARWGDSVTRKEHDRPPWANWRIVRQEGAGGRTGDDVYSVMNNGMIFPDIKNNQPDWPTQGNESGDSLEQAIYHGQKLRQSLENSTDSFVLHRQYKTQSIEPMMMEPEAYNGWFDRASKTLHIVATVQDPQEVAKEAAHVVESSNLKGSVETVVMHSPFIGGGFGAKDHSIFSAYGLLAALYAGRPMRLANDRFEQFQSGLKRHPFDIDLKLAINKSSLKFEGLVADIKVDGGGRANFSGVVTMVGASAIQSIYYFPRNDINATCVASPGVDCGSMRGFGTLQTMAAMEMAVNEAADQMGVDPFDIRAANMMLSGDKNTQGAIPNMGLRYDEMIASARQHDKWVNRAANKQAYEADNPGYLYGVGYGIATKDYGTGAEAPAAMIELGRDGHIQIRVNSMEMGTGTQTSQAVVAQRYVGRLAHDVVMAEVDKWSSLQQFESYNPYFISQEQQDEASKDPRWTPVVAMASSASQSSYYQSHSTEVAARILFRHTLWPAAVSIWKASYFNSRYAAIDFGDIDNARWSGGKLTANGYPPLDLATLMDYAYENNMITGVMVHAFNRWAWAEADFAIEGKNETHTIDALALRQGDGSNAGADDNGYQLVERSRVDYPKASLNNAMVTYYAPAAALAELRVHKATGQVEILSTHSWLETGRMHVRELVEGQIEGGLVMGIGHTLLEYMPTDQTGPGDGTWNLNRYDVPKAKHVAVWNMTHEILPPLSDTDPAKGIGEVVMIPIVSAIVQGLHQATGTYFYDLPIKPKQVKEALS